MAKPALLVSLLISLFFFTLPLKGVQAAGGGDLYYTESGNKYLLYHDPETVNSIWEPLGDNLQTIVIAAGSKIKFVNNWRAVLYPWLGQMQVQDYVTFTGTVNDIYYPQQGAEPYYMHVAVGRNLYYINYNFTQGPRTYLIYQDPQIINAVWSPLGGNVENLVIAAGNKIKIISNWKAAMYPWLGKVRVQDYVTFTTQVNDIYFPQRGSDLCCLYAAVGNNIYYIINGTPYFIYQDPETINAVWEPFGDNIQNMVIAAGKKVKFLRNWQAVLYPWRGQMQVQDYVSFSTEIRDIYFPQMGADLGYLYVAVTGEVAAPPGPPTSLLTNDQVNPTNLTGIPFFSAIYNDPNTDDIANAYQLHLDDNSDFSSPLWDSGIANMSNCLQGNRCQNISYNGSAVTPGVRYYWRIRYQDDENTLGEWSTESAYFELLANGTLTGYVWQDGDGNCQRGAGEANYYDVSKPVVLELKESGVTVIPSFGTNNTLSPGNNFTITGIPFGTYELVLTPAQGWRVTTDTRVAVTINPGQVTQVTPQCL